MTTVGRGAGVDIALEDPSVSRLHAELIRRGPHVYVSDLGLSTNGTRVNGRPIGRRVLVEGDVLSFGNVPHPRQRHPAPARTTTRSSCGASPRPT